LNSYTFHISLYDVIFFTMIIVGLVFALLLAFVRNVSRTANRFLALGLVTMIFWMVRVLVMDLRPGSRLPVQFLLAFGPLLYFYVLKITNPKPTLCWKDLLHFIPLLLEQAMLPFQQLTPVLQLLIFISIIAYLRQSYKLILRFYTRQPIVMMDRPRLEFRWLRRLLAATGLLWLLWIVCAIVDYFGYHNQLGIQVYYPFYIFFAIMMIWFAAAAFLKPQAAAMSQAAAPARQPIPAELRAKGAWLKRAMEANLYYEDPELTVTTLAGKLRMQPRELSYVINTAHKKGFNDFINEYRVRDMVAKMQDPANDNITLQGIAFDAGFNSKATFIRAFKQFTGKTPAEYKRELENKVSIPALQPHRARAAVTSSQQLNRSFMFSNYFKTAWRNLWRFPAVSAIKIFGLSIGLTVCLLIFLFSKDDISFDRFHTNRNDIFRVTIDMRVSNQPEQIMGITQFPLGEAFRAEIPGVKERVRVLDIPITVKKGNDVFNESPLAADDNFFSVFSFGLLKGDQRTALKNTYSIVLTETAAKKYFGTTDVVGQTMEVKKNDAFERFTVTGVTADPPQNSTVTFTMLVPFNYYKKGLTRDGWIGGTLNTFLLLEPGTDQKVIAQKMQAIFDKNTQEQIKQAEKENQMTVSIKLGLQPLLDIHTNKQIGAGNGLAEVTSPVYSYLLSGIAIFILLVACINFINLSIGQSLKRSREIGIRKVMGGNRRQLVWQFLTESFLVSLFAFVLAIVLAMLLLPLFNGLTGKELSLSYLADGWLYAGWFALLILTSFIAGFYPSLVLSAFQPLKVLSGRYKLMGKNYLARGLVVFQFTLAIFLVIGTVAIYTQLNFLSKQPLGYDSSNLVRINLAFSDKNDILAERFKTELAGKPGIQSVAVRNMGMMGSGVRADGKEINIDLNFVDENFFATFKIPLKQGRNFSRAFGSDSVQSAIINETFVNQAGWQNTGAVGKTFQSMEDNKIFTVVGVIKDYHYRSLKQNIEAQVFTLGPAKQYGQLWVKISPDNVPATLRLLSETFHKLLPLFPYSYSFMDAVNAREYDKEAKWKQAIGIAAVLFIFIACIGLLGLVMLSIEQRQKEIGIRKVLGAASAKIFLLISGQFTLLVGIAFVLAIPAGYYAVYQWLQDFPYRIAISWWIFGLSGAIILLVALLAISFRAVRASVANPVKSLRTE